MDIEHAGRGLASRINKLFNVFHADNTPPLSNAAAALAICEKTGVSIKAELLGQLRDGSEIAATVAHLEAIADFFGVPAAYLTDRDLDAAIDAQLDLLNVLRDKRIRDATLCLSARLSPQALKTLAVTIASLPE